MAARKEPLRGRGHSPLISIAPPRRSCRPGGKLSRSPPGAGGASALTRSRLCSWTRRWRCSRDNRGLGCGHPAPRTASPPQTLGPSLAGRAPRSRTAVGTSGSASREISELPLSPGAAPCQRQAVDPEPDRPKPGMRPTAMPHTTGYP